MSPCLHLHARVSGQEKWWRAFLQNFQQAQNIRLQNLSSSFGNGPTTQANSSQHEDISLAIHTLHTAHLTLCPTMAAVSLAESLHFMHAKPDQFSLIKTEVEEETLTEEVTTTQEVEVVLPTAEEEEGEGESYCP